MITMIPNAPKTVAWPIYQQGRLAKNRMRTRSWYMPTVNTSVLSLKFM